MPLDRKLAIVDLTKGDIEIKSIPLEARKKYLGGRGFNAYLLLNHTKKDVDPYSPGNVVLFAGGLLCGMLASATGRCDVMTKSPLTHLLSSGNMGGFFAPELAHAGFHHILVKGKADHPVYIYCHNGEVQIRDARDIWGMSVTDTQWAIRDDIGNQEVKCAVIGPAGENLVAYANVMSGIKNSAGRCGGGAVMGAKNLKAIAALGTMDIKVAYPLEALEYNRRFIDQIASAKVNQTQGTLGTPFIWGATNSWGGIRTRNFQYNQTEYADDIEPEHLDEIAEETCGEYHMTACFGCQVHCRAQYRIPDGPYKGVYDEGPEYTSQGAFGGETDTPRAVTVLTCNHLVDKYGVDNLEIGSLISWAMELVEKGILTTDQLDGVDLRFGNDDAVIEMIDRIVFRKGWLGDTLAKGGIQASDEIGMNSFDYLIQVKGMSNLHSDERATPSLALNCALASRGSDHLRSRPAIDLYHLPEPILRKIYSSPIPYDGPLSSDHTEYIGKAWQVYWQENCYMAIDCLGICKYHTTFLGATLPNFEDWARVIFLNIGLDMTPEDIWHIARRCNMIERIYQLREGLKREDLRKGDMLNHRYFDEPCRRGAPGVVGRVIDKEKFVKMVDEFYEFKGLDKEGRPKPETLKELDLDMEPLYFLE